MSFPILAPEKPALTEIRISETNFWTFNIQKIYLKGKTGILNLAVVVLLILIRIPFVLEWKFVISAFKLIEFSNIYYRHDFDFSTDQITKLQYNYTPRTEERILEISR